MLMDTISKNDQPKTNQLDLEALSHAKSYMGEFAVMTIVLGLSMAIIYLATLLLVAQGEVPLIAGLFVISAIAYAMYTIMHDAVHGSIQGKHRHYRWVNEGMGYLAGQILLLPFTVHRRSHLTHHAKTNQANLDPDLGYQFAGRSPFHLLFLSATTIYTQIQYYVTQCWSKNSNRENARVVIEMTVAISWRIAFMMQGYWWEGFVLFIGGAILGNAITVYFFAYLVHHPHTEVGRWVDTSTFVFRNKMGVLVDWLWLFQNYHSIHHLFPRIPFYRYRELFDDIETVMVAQHSPIHYVSNPGSKVHGVDHEGE